MKTWISILALVSTSLSIAAVAVADDTHPHGPPPEAFAACASLKEGDACTVQFRDKTLDGKCVTAREDSKLFCLPNDLPPPPPSGTPLPSPPP